MTAKKSQSGGQEFLVFPVFNFSLIRTKKIEKKKLFSKIMKKSRPFLAHPPGGQETTFYLRVASGVGGGGAKNNSHYLYGGLGTKTGISWGKGVVQWVACGT